MFATGDLVLDEQGRHQHATLESYDFTFNLGVNQAQIMDLATCRYLEEKVPVLIVGPCGTGKSHLAQALGNIAVRRGYDTVFASHVKLLGQLDSARAVGNYERKLAALTQGGPAHHRRLGLKAHAQPSRMRDSLTSSWIVMSDGCKQSLRQPRPLGVERRLPQQAAGRGYS